ncbi:hypothetical protein [Georgenia sp. SYP-B2076]|uniref:hypothetical protein n=1 Tax=Georgenia sp. SYP-B2076 TaxID=2495881 RepID=UPI000F8D9759|nr:hypothetical protein [Georgenia sp. SYP-B2076]
MALHSVKSPVLCTYGYSSKKYCAAASAPATSSRRIDAGATGFSTAGGFGVADAVGSAGWVAAGRLGDGDGVGSASASALHPASRAAASSNRAAALPAGHLSP